MTLNEAINYHTERAYYGGFSVDAQHENQLVDWLIELKWRREEDKAKDEEENK